MTVVLPSARRRARPAAKQWRRKGAPYLYVAPALLFLLALELYPIAYNLRNSLVDVNVGTFLGNDAPFVGLDNYEKVINDEAFRHAVGVSLIFTAACIVLQFSIGLALALFFARPSRGRALCGPARARLAAARRRHRQPVPLPARRRL